MTDAMRSAAAKRAAATRRRNKQRGEASVALEAAARASEYMIIAFRAEGLEIDGDAIRQLYADLGAQIDKRNGY